MKTYLIRMLLGSVLAVFTVFCWTVYAQRKQSQKVVWEYTVVAARWASDDSQRLSELGKDGWELISVRTEEQMAGNFRQFRIYYYLKRSTETAN